jgi:hypothetical protein
VLALCLLHAPAIAHAQSTDEEEQRATEPAEPSDAEAEGIQPPESGAFTPGEGFLVGSTPFGELRLSM